MADVNEKTSVWLVPTILGVSCLLLMVVAYGLKNKWSLLPSTEYFYEFGKIWAEYFIFRHACLYFLFTIIYFLLFSLTEEYNNEFAGKPKFINLVDALYHSAVTQSTVGYGDISPVGHWGKLVSILHQFSSIYINLDFTSDVIEQTVEEIVKRENAFVKKAINEQTQKLLLIK